MQAPPPSLLLTQLPAAVLGHIARLSHWQHTLRRTCTALRDAVTPERITIDYMKVTDGQQNLHLSRQLALAWRGVAHVDVLTQNFRTAKMADDLNRMRASGSDAPEIDLDILAAVHPERERNHTKRSTAQHMLRLRDYFNRAVSALVYWQHIQTACIPLDSSIVSVLVAQCRIKSLELSDRTFENVDSAFPEEEAVRPQVAACLQLLQGRESLRNLKLDLRVARLGEEHLQLLQHLTHLEDLDLVVHDDEFTKQGVVSIDTAGVIATVRHLKRLVHLKLDLVGFCSSECRVDLGDMPALRSILLDLGQESGPDSCVINPSLFEGCPLLEKVVLGKGIYPDAPINWSCLHYLTHIDLGKTTLDDPVITALAACPNLTHLKGGALRVTNTCAAVLRVLHELHVHDVETCQVPFRVFAPQLHAISCMGDVALIALQDHPTLSSVRLPFLQITDTRVDELQGAPTCLTLVRTLDVVFSGACTNSPPAPSMVTWAAGIRELQLTGALDYTPASQLLLAVRGMTGLRVLRILGYNDGLQDQHKMADAIVSTLASVIGRGVTSVQSVELDVRWLMFERSGGTTEGWLLYLIVVLNGLASAPNLKLVRLVHPGKAFEGMREGSKEHDLFREIGRCVEVAQQMQRLQFHVEVV